MAGKRRLILFARYPVPGCVKTRLIPALGAEGAAALHRRLVLRTLRTAQAACRATGAELEIRFDGGNGKGLCHWLGDGWSCRAQAAGDLGLRMAQAFEDSFREGSLATLIIGSDCPGLTPELLATAFARLSSGPVVFGPATDGGYYLIGLTQAVPELFRDLPWGTAAVLADSLRRLARRGLKPALLNPLDDLDCPRDLPGWRRIAEAEDADPGPASVIIPARNEAGQIARTIHSVRQGNPAEVIVVDGGSADATPQLSREAGARVLESAPGRARQMNAGAAQATGNSLLFLHADTLLPPGWSRVLSETLRQPGTAAGAFQFRIAGDFPGKRWVEWTTNWRSRHCQLPYGDQALFLRRSSFEELGGYADLPIMEDYELVRRLRRRGRVVTADTAAITSGRRWQKLGLLRTTLINRLVVAGYRLGLDSHRLARFYARAAGQ